MLQEFDMEIHDKKGFKNAMANHSSWIENKERLEESTPICDSFSDEQLLQVNALTLPRFVDYINFLAGQVIPLEFT